MNIANPYHNVARINDHKLFYNREELIESLLNSMFSFSPQSHAIVGQRKIGKTSLVTHLYRPSTRDKFGFVSDNCFFVYFDCQLRADALFSTEKLLNEMLRCVRTELISQFPSILHSFINEVHTDVYKEWDQLLKELRNNKLRLIFIFDEFEKAISKRTLFDGNFFGIVRGYAQMDVFAYVTCTSQRLDILFDEAAISFDISQETFRDSSDFFNVAVTNYVRLFSEQDILLLITEPSDAAGVRFSTNEVDTILYFGGRFPFFTQRICYNLFAAHKRGAFSIEQILQECLNEAMPFWQKYWNRLTDDQQRLLLAIVNKDLCNHNKYEIEQLKAISLIYEERGGELFVFSQAFAQFIRDKKNLPGPKASQTPNQSSPQITRKTVGFKLQLGRLLNLEFETRVLASPMGETVGKGKSPCTQEQLVTVLKALQAPQYQEQNFTPPQRDDLKQLGLLTNPHFIPNLQQRIGEMLFRGLLADQKVHSAFQAAITQARANNEIIAFQLRFDEDVTELARYPWELLYDGRRALLPSGIMELARYISYPEATTRLSAPTPLRLLYITSRPNNLPGLSPDIERHATRESLQSLENDGQLHIDDLPRATYYALVDYLDTYKPHILHFDGHGRFHRRCHVCHTFYYPHITQCENCMAPLPDPQGYLAFEQEGGEVDWISSETLGHLFNSSLRLALLSACYSGTVRGESLFGGVGPALVQAGVPAVVATQLPISVDAAKEFAKGFYRALARYDSLAAAVNAGRRRLFNTKEWFIPVLYLRSQDDQGQLFIQQ